MGPSNTQRIREMLDYVVKNADHHGHGKFISDRDREFYGITTSKKGMQPSNRTVADSLSSESEHPPDAQYSTKDTRQRKRHRPGAQAPAHPGRSRPPGSRGQMMVEQAGDASHTGTHHNSSTHNTQWGEWGLDHHHNALPPAHSLLLLHDRKQVLWFTTIQNQGTEENGLDRGGGVASTGGPQPEAVAHHIGLLPQNRRLPSGHTFYGLLRLHQGRPKGRCGCG